MKEGDFRVPRTWQPREFAFHGESEHERHSEFGWLTLRPAKAYTSCEEREVTAQGQADSKLPTTVAPRGCDSEGVEPDSPAPVVEQAC